MKCVSLDGDTTGLVAMLGEVIDAAAQPMLGYMSDHMETPYGQRVPVYFISAMFTLPAFFLMFNPPDFAIGSNEMDPKPWAPYFIGLCAIM